MRIAIILTLAASLSGCSGQALASLYCGGSPPTSNNPVVPQLLYPVPGVANVPDNAPTMVVAYSLSPAAAFQIDIVSAGGSPIQVGGMTSPPNPLPKPIAKELVPGTPMYGAALPPLAAHTTYAVAYRDVTSYCGRSSVNLYKMGSFTTH
jgi:hypothetical protein